MPHYEQPVKRQPGKLKIVELFETVQGEGLLIGVPSVFVRTGACNLECAGCDTVWDRWDERPIESVAAEIKTYKSKHVVLTGGEPTLWQEDLVELIKLLPYHHFTVETNGAVPLNSLMLQLVDLWSFSPKVGSLGHDEAFSKEVVANNIRAAHNNCLNGAVQIKYVLDPNVPAHVESVFNFQVGHVGNWVRDDNVFFQPYDHGHLVNIKERTHPFDEFGHYNRDLAALTKLVMERSGSRFRVVPQLHKYLSWR